MSLQPAEAEDRQGSSTPSKTVIVRSGQCEPTNAVQALMGLLRLPPVPWDED